MQIIVCDCFTLSDKSIVQQDIHPNIELIQSLIMKIR